MYFFLLDVLSLKSNAYNIESAGVVKIVFNFFWITKNNNIPDDKWQDLNRTFALSNEVLTFNIGKEHIPLPSNRNYASWGTVSTQSDVNLIVTLENIQKQYVMLEWNKLTKKVTISGFPHTFTDSFLPDGILRRSFSDGTTFYIKNDSIILKTKSMKTEFMQTLKVDEKSENSLFNIGIFNGATLDIETVLQNGKHVPYLFSFYDGVNKYSFFEKEPTNLFKTMLLSKYRGKTVYAHNLSRFDIVFLFKHLAKLQKEGYKINILKKEDKIISITIVKGKNTCLTLKDSLLLLPSSLEKLCKNFNLETGKLVEPVFVGTGMNKFKSDNLDHYSKDIERIEDLVIWKPKIQAYCEQDCKALWSPEFSNNPIKYVFFNFFYIPKGSEGNYRTLEGLKNNRSSDKVIEKSFRMKFVDVVIFGIFIEKYSFINSNLFNNLDLFLLSW
uniref:Probable DNA polymerase n=1 Tax=Coniophora olivacea TaxID=85977 RepID=A0A896Z1E1_9AGAM